ncbi:MAG: hypothetical protein HY298_02805 [Verrucomicrobia bacterium]|nr:hypothetical protein [Verrucomicrobiota bacterium]
MKTMPFNSVENSMRANISCRSRQMFAGVTVCTLLGLASTVRSQTEVIEDFNNAIAPAPGWGNYDPGAGLGQPYTRTKVADGSGSVNGFAYRQFAPGTQCANIITRGGIYRPETYSTFFESVELNNFDAGMDAADFLFGARIGNAVSAPGQLTGYVTVYAPGTLRARQGLLANIEFVAEITSGFMDLYRGGAAPMAQIPPGRKTRLVYSGSGDTMKAELYDVTDLLEPLVRINFQDSSGNASSHTTGSDLLGFLNLEFEERSDWTVDNFHATGNPNTYVGFPGQAQVVNLKPAPQTLFYQPPGTGSNITFTITTFSANTTIDTNQLKLFLNEVDVSGSGFGVTEVRTPIVGTPNTNFTVVWKGSLSSNTVYHGQIRVLDNSGKGTTNNFYFDTFTFFNPTNPANPSGFVLIEAEDYNYGSGQKQDYPLVSGTDDTTTTFDPIFDASCVCTPAPTDVLGPQVNGGGVGYFDQQGTLDVDYHDARGTSLNSRERNQYRTLDSVGTTQGTKGGGFDTPRSYRSNLVNQSSGTSYVPDYVVSDIQPGDWMNYTRTFPAGNYLVYLRASSQGRQDVRLDEVTSGETTTSQTTALRGQFLVPNSGGATRFRYVPLTDEAGNPQVLNLSGLKTLRLTANQVRTGVTPTDDPVSDLQLNWILFVPTNGAASSQPYIASAVPSANSDNSGPTPNVNVVILDRATSVNTNSIVLRLDGVNVTSLATITGTTTEGAGATISYSPSGFMLPGSVHTLGVVFSDGSTTQSNQWNFTIEPNTALLTPSDAVGGSPDTNFFLLVNKAQNGSDPTACPVQGPFDNLIPRAEQQLAGQLINSDAASPYANEAAGTNGGFYTEPESINFQQCGVDDASKLFHSGIKPYPGIPLADTNNGTYECGVSGDPDHFAIAATIKLQLAAGAYRMGVNADDHFKVTAGGAGGTNVFLAQSINSLPGTRGDGQFEFVVQSSGVYNFRLVQEEGGGGAFVEWYWVNQSTGVRTLVTPPPPIQLLSAATVNGTYNVEGAAAIDTGTKTVSVTKPADTTRFYKLSAASALNITNITLSGGNVVLKYQ